MYEKMGMSQGWAQLYQINAITITVTITSAYKITNQLQLQLEGLVGFVCHERSPDESSNIHH